MNLEKGFKTKYGLVVFPIQTCFGIRFVLKKEIQFLKDFIENNLWNVSQVKRGSHFSHQKDMIN